MRKKLLILKIYNNGFTLLESMIVICIFGILMAIAIPSFSVMLPNYRLKSAAQDMYSNLQLAKMTAIKENSYVSVTFNTSTSPLQIGGIEYDYIVFRDKNHNLEYDSGDTIITSKRWIDYKGVSFDTSKSDGDGVDFPDNDQSRGSIAFRSNGMPVNNAGGVGSGAVYLINSKGRASEVDLSIAGNIKIQ